MRILLTLAVSVLLSACLASKPSAPKALPDWVLNPQADNPGTLYASGSGFDRAQAEKQALSQLISRIRVSIESKLQINRVDDRGHASTSAEERIKSTVRKTEISQYDVAKVFNDGDQVHVMVAVDRQALIALWRSKHQQALAQLEQQQQTYADSRWQQLLAVRQWKTNVGESRYWAELLSSLGDDSARNAQQRGEDNADQLEQQLKQGLKVRLRGPKQADALLTQLDRLLAQDGIRTVAHNGNVNIRLDQNKKQQEAFGSKQVLINVELTVTESGQQLQQVSYKAKGASASSFGNAEKIAQDQMAKKWAGLPLWSLLGQ